jgi:ferredoxin-nitrite reductase
VHWYASLHDKESYDLILQIQRDYSVRTLAYHIAGAAFCGQALSNTKEPIHDIIEQLQADLHIPERVQMQVSGCPNTCGQSQIGDIGLIGSPAKKDGKAVEGFQIFRGGTRGEHAEFAAKELDQAVPIDEAYDHIKDLLVKHHGATEREQSKTSATIS